MWLVTMASGETLLVSGAWRFGLVLTRPFGMVGAGPKLTWPLHPLISSVGLLGRPPLLWLPLW